MGREAGLSYVCSGNINPATFVALATGGVMNTVSVCASGSPPLGISQEAQKFPPGIFQNPSMAGQTNDEILVYLVGDYCMLTASSAGFTMGDLLQCDANGYGQKVAQGGGLFYGAIAQETVPAGAWGRVLVSQGKA